MPSDPFAPAFAPEEFERRLRSVRHGMSHRGIDLLLLFSPENVSYITGYETIGYSSFLCLMVPPVEAPRMIVREMELDVAQATTWLTNFATISDGEDPVKVASRAILEMRDAGQTIGVEETSSFLNARTFRSLIQELSRSGTATVDGSELVEPVRRIKSPDELNLIRAACELTCLGMRSAVDAVKIGATENQVASAAFAAMVEGGSDFMAGGPIVTSGIRGSIAHTTFANGRIDDGDPVLIELGACRHRYGGALMRTVGVGGGGHRFPDLATVLDEALDAALAAIEPGRTCGSVDAACRSRIEGGGLGEWFRKRTGYSIGVAFAPDWGEGHIASLGPGEEMLLEAGMTFHVPPAVRLPGEAVYGVSETVAVTEDGCEVLTDFPRRLER